MLELSAARLSALIGAVHDCALDPALWPETMRQICGELDCVVGRLMLADLDSGALRFGSAWNEPPGAAELLGRQYGGEVAAAMRAALGDPAYDADTPYVLSRHPGGVDVLAQPVSRDWAGPFGWCGAMNTVVLRDGPRLGVFSAVRHRDSGLLTDRGIALMRLLAPHLRRAVAIGDALEMRALETEALAGAMDGLAVGIGVVAADGTLLHANAAARRMMQADGPLRADRGRLAGRRKAATTELQAAIALAAAGDPARMGRAGIGVALGGPGDPPAVAHVLPLDGRTGPRRRLLPRAAATVFVSEVRPEAPHGLEAVAASLGLTPAEARLFGRLVAGTSLAEAAAALGIAATTARTHLARIFAKTGVSRQAELVALAGRLLPPLR